MPHENDETLSALIDAELSAPDAERARAHAVSCTECSTRLERLRAAGAAFRRSGERPIPAGLAERAKGEVRPRRFLAKLRVNALELALGATIVAAVVLMGGVALKKFMPVLFNNVQQMITGAASQMGSGRK